MTRPLIPCEARPAALPLCVSALLASVVINAALIFDVRVLNDKLALTQQKLNAQTINTQLDVDTVCIAWMFRTDFKDARKRVCRGEQK